jgi:hypothetical protein
VELVRSIKENTPKDIKIQAVNLGANGKKAAYVNDLYKKISCVFHAVPTLITDHSNILNRARQELFKELIEDKGYIPPKSAVTLDVLYQKERMSSCTLNLS